MTEQRKVCFQVTEEQYQTVKSLPRSYNLSEKLRESLNKIIEKAEKSNKGAAKL